MNTETSERYILVAILVPMYFNMEESVIVMVYFLKIGFAGDRMISISSLENTSGYFQSC